MHNIPITYVVGVLVQMMIGGVSNRSVRNIFKTNLKVDHARRRIHRLPKHLVPRLKPPRKLLRYIQRFPKKTAVGLGQFACVRSEHREDLGG